MDPRKLHPAYLLRHRDRIIPHLRWRTGRLLAPFYLGRDHQCPVCGFRLRRFATFVSSPTRAGRPEQCPFCGSLPRTRATWLYLERELLGRTARILHIAPEPGLLRRLRRTPGFSVTTLDASRTDVDVQASLTALPFEGTRFDLLLCSHVLEHVPDDRAAISEMYRVLSPGGLAIIHVPIGGDTTREDPAVTSSEERDRLYGQFDHVRMYGRDIAERLAEAGFAVEPSYLAAHLGPPTRYGLDVNELAYLCRR